MDILFDLYQQSRINQATNTAQTARDVAAKAQWDIDDLKRKADALTLACQALWEILRSQTGISDDVILNKIQEIDLRDGQADGRITQRVRPCPNCARRTRPAALPAFIVERRCRSTTSLRKVEALGVGNHETVESRASGARA